MRIVNLKIEGFKRIQAVEIKPSNGMVYIAGKNAQGKTSVLDAIWAAIKYPGQKELPQPVNTKARAAKIEVDLGDLTVRRVFSEGGGNSLQVISKDNRVYQSPQAVLDGFVGKLTFDPLKFYTLDGAKQWDFLADALGIKREMQKLETDYEGIYGDRTDVNRQIKAVTAVLPNLEPEKVGAVDIAKLIDELAKAREEKAEIERKERRLESLAQGMKAQSDKVARLVEELRQAEKDLIVWKEQYEAAKKELAKPLEYDIGRLEESLAKAEETNARARERATYDENVKELGRLQEEADTLTAGLSEVKSQQSELLGAAKMPLEGLAFERQQVTFNGIPVKQASSAEQIRISLAIAMAINPKLRVIRIANGSLLDEDNRELIAEIAKSKDYQVWIETVDDEKSVGFVIENGRLKQ